MFECNKSYRNCPEPDKLLTCREGAFLQQVNIEVDGGEGGLRIRHKMGGSAEWYFMGNEFWLRTYTEGMEEWKPEAKFS